MTRRSGMTLIEVLVAIFVMSIGMIALLTLFPIGILQMARAIQQDKCVKACQAADSVSILLNVRNDPTVITDNTVFPKVVDYFSNPKPAGIGVATPMPAADPYGPSYAVMVDPSGFLTNSATPVPRSWIGGIAPNGVGATTGALSRRPLTITNYGLLPPVTNLNSFAGKSQSIKYWLSLQDEPIFDNNPFDPVTTPLPGTPKLVGAGTMMRDAPFTWTYLLQRPRTGDPSAVNCTIVVFENRPLLLTNTGKALTLPEYVYQDQAAFDMQTNTITVTTLLGAPNVKPGDWVYDATIILPKPNVYVYPEIASAFYRVVAVDQTGPSTYRFELQSPIRPMRQDPGFYMTPQQRTLPGTLIAMDGIVEVFEKGPVRVP